MAGMPGTHGEAGPRGQKVSQTWHYNKSFANLQTTYLKHE